MKNQKLKQVSQSFQDPVVHLYGRAGNWIKVYLIVPNPTVP
jgi:hypothetical protein